jgi:hypothetical protein
MLIAFLLLLMGKGHDPACAGREYLSEFSFVKLG